MHSPRQNSPEALDPVENPLEFMHLGGREIAVTRIFGLLGRYELFTTAPLRTLSKAVAPLPQTRPH